MQADRRLMDQALRAVVVPHLRALGFVGRLPHLRRKRNDQLQLLSIMFNKYGGSFYVEAGVLSQERVGELQRHWAEAGKTLAESELDVGHCSWDERVRLGAPKVDVNSDHWFVFGPDRFTESSVQPASHYAAVAAQALVAIQRQLDPFLDPSLSPPAEA